MDDVIIKKRFGRLEIEPALALLFIVLKQNLRVNSG